MKTITIAVVLLLLVTETGCSGPFVAPANATPATATETSWQWEEVPKQHRIMVWGGTSSYPHDTQSNTETDLDPANLNNNSQFPNDKTICWDTFQVGSKGRGERASYLIVRPDIGIGIAIRDDAPFQRPRLCTKGLPTVSLINNWTEHQVMTFFIEGEIVN